MTYRRIPKQNQVHSPFFGLQHVELHYTTLSAPKNINHTRVQCGVRHDAAGCMFRAELFRDCSRLCVHELLQHVFRGRRADFVSRCLDLPGWREGAFPRHLAGQHLHTALIISAPLLIYWFLTRRPTRQTYPSGLRIAREANCKPWLAANVWEFVSNHGW